MVKFAIVQNTTPNWNFEKDVQGYSDAGIEGIGVCWDKLQAYGVAKGIDLLKNSGLVVSSLIGIGWFTMDPSVHLPFRIEDPQEAIELTAELGANYLTVVAGPPYKYSLKEALVVNMDIIAQLVPIAQAKGVRLALEPLHPIYTWDSSVVNTLGVALDVVEAIDSPHLGLLLDTYHIWWDHNLETLIPRAAGRIFGVHVNDWRHPPPSFYSGRAMMGEGIIPIGRILRLIEATGYEGFYEVEVLSEELWESDHTELVSRCRASFNSIMLESKL